MRAYKAAIQEAEQQKPNSEERRPDDMLETANHLIRISIQALMRMRGVDWETAIRWIKAAAATATPEKLKKPPSRPNNSPSRKRSQPLGQPSQNSPHTPA